MSENSTIFFIVADITAPAPEPFMVLRVDVEKRIGDGVEGVVISKHMTRAAATAAASDLQNAFEQGHSS
jgi:hypothetical protein